METDIPLHPGGLQIICGSIFGLILPDVQREQFRREKAQAQNKGQRRNQPSARDCLTPTTFQRQGSNEHLFEATSSIYKLTRPRGTSTLMSWPRKSLARLARLSIGTNSPKSRVRGRGTSHAIQKVSPRVTLSSSISPQELLDHDAL